MTEEETLIVKEKVTYKEKISNRKALLSLSNYLLKKTQKRAVKLQERAARKAEKDEAAKK